MRIAFVFVFILLLIQTTGFAIMGKLNMLNSDFLYGDIINSEIIILTDYSELRIPISSIKEISSPTGKYARATIRTIYFGEIITGILLTESLSVKIYDSIVEIPIKSIENAILETDRISLKDFFFLKSVGADLIYCKLLDESLLVQSSYSIVELPTENINTIRRDELDKNIFVIESNIGVIKGKILNKPLELLHPSKKVYQIDPEMIQILSSENENALFGNNSSDNYVDALIFQESVPLISDKETWGKLLKIPDNIFCKHFILFVRVFLKNSKRKSYEVWLSPNYFGEPYLQVGFWGDGGISHAFRYSLVSKGTSNGEVVIEIPSESLPQEFYIIIDNTVIGNVKNEPIIGINLTNLDVFVYAVYLK